MKKNQFSLLDVVVIFLAIAMVFAIIILVVLANEPGLLKALLP